MNIGIDCRMYGPKHTGIGRYVQNLIENLLILDKGNVYTLFISSSQTKEIKNLNLKCKIVVVDIPHYSLKEQVFFPSLIGREKLGLMHFPHFNVPIFYNGKYVVTIHDLIKHESKGSSTTTRNPMIYWLKYLGYKLVFNFAVKRASKIITPSNFVKNQLVKNYKISKDKITVTYEGVDLSIKKQVLSSEEDSEKILEKYNIEKPYLLYVGNIYPHKNIERLIQSVKDLKINLIVVCARNVFSKRLGNKITQLQAGDFVKFTGFVADEELRVLYQQAEAFLFPTLSEGFGLPGLEAMAARAPVICSDIPVLREIYKDSAIFFNPYSIEDIKEKIINFLSDNKIREELKRKGFLLSKEYSWQKMAKETLQVYSSSAS